MSEGGCTSHDEGCVQICCVFGINDNYSAGLLFVPSSVHMELPTHPYCCVCVWGGVYVCMCMYVCVCGGGRGGRVMKALVIKKLYKDLWLLKCRISWWLLVIEGWIPCGRTKINHFGYSTALLANRQCTLMGDYLLGCSHMNDSSASPVCRHWSVQSVCSYVMWLRPLDNGRVIYMLAFYFCGVFITRWLG